MLRVDDVGSCEFKLKAGKKEKSVVKLRRSKLKIDLVCENEVVGEKGWALGLAPGVDTFGCGGRCPKSGLPR